MRNVRRVQTCMMHVWHFRLVPSEGFSLSNMPTTCEGCGHRFSRADNYARHLRNGACPRPGRSGSVCPRCDQMITGRPSALRRHMASPLCRRFSALATDREQHDLLVAREAGERVTGTQQYSHSTARLRQHHSYWSAPQSAVSAQ
jgi:uncharacterized Zn-finger protein